MRPIPRAMLTHSATLLQPAGDVYQEEMLTPVALLTRVRVEATLAQTDLKDNSQPAHAALLMYDARHSRPAGVMFAPGQRVLAGGILYRVDTVECFYDNRKLHHAEVGLKR